MKILFFLSCFLDSWTLHASTNTISAQTIFRSLCRRMVYQQNGFVCVLSDYFCPQNFLHRYYKKMVFLLYVCEYAPEAARDERRIFHRKDIRSLHRGCACAQQERLDYCTHVHSSRIFSHLGWFGEIVCVELDYCYCCNFLYKYHSCKQFGNQPRF